MRGGGGDVALLADGFCIINRQCFDSSAAAVAKTTAGEDADGVCAHRVDVFQDFLLRAITQGHHRYHRSDTDDNPQHGQQRTHFVRHNCLYRHFECFHKLIVIKRPGSFFFNPLHFAGRNIGIFRRIRNNLTVADFDDAVCVCRNARIVGDHNHGMPVFVQLMDDFHHIFTAGGIQCAGRLVGKDDFAAVHQSAGNRNTLLLTTGKLAGFVAFFILQAQIAQQFFRTFRALFAVHAHIHGRQGDVVPGGQRA